MQILYDHILFIALRDIEAGEEINAASMAKLDEIGGAQTLYDPATAGPGTGPGAAATERDVCLGSGAHTHYFETDQAVVGGWIDELIAR